jgi:hypothetical protein
VKGFSCPFWRADAKISQSNGVLAGSADANTASWQKLTAESFKQR